MSITFDSMILILPQTKFEAIPSKDAGEVAFQLEANRSHQIPGGCTWNDFYTSCLSPFSLRKGSNITVNLGPRISKKGCLFKNFQIF